MRAGSGEKIGDDPGVLALKEALHNSETVDS
jgi:hypothetical protein